MRLWVFSLSERSAFAQDERKLGELTNRSSRVIPGFLGTPAGMTTISASFKALSAPLSAGKKPST
jgi:hypothetical protein